MLQLPRDASARSELLLVRAEARRPSPRCADTYLRALCGVVAGGPAERRLRLFDFRATPIARGATGLELL